MLYHSKTLYQKLYRWLAKLYHWLSKLYHWLAKLYHSKTLYHWNVWNCCREGFDVSHVKGLGDATGFGEALCPYARAGGTWWAHSGIGMRFLEKGVRLGLILRKILIKKEIIN